MLVRKESILKNLVARAVEEKSIIYLDAFMHNARMIDVMFTRINQLLINNNIDINQDGISELLMIDAWGIVDCFFRIKKILHVIPGVKKKEIWFQVFIRKISSVEDFRHYIQHLDQELPELVKNKNPIAGYLCWLKVIKVKKEVEIGTLVPGRIKPKKLRLINPCDKAIYGDKIDRITLFFGDNDLDLSELCRALFSFVSSLEEYLENKYPQK